MSLKMWNLAASKLRTKARATLLLVAESGGSSPGRAGFKMVVTEDGLSGSVGGGVMEVGLVERAREMLRSRDDGRNAVLFDFVHRRDVPNASGMICSGRQTVIACLLGADDLGPIEALAGGGAVLVMTEKGLASKPAQGLGAGGPSFERRDDGGFVYEERPDARDRLIIVGGGHCALALSELASGLGFAISLFDDRAGLNTLEKNSFADEITVLESYERIGEYIVEDVDAFVVVMTLGYKFDETVVRALSGRKFRYFGVLGSEAKIRTMFAALEKEGIDRDWLQTLRAPIGVKINSRTPAEIAVSIAAELIGVRNGV